MKKVGFVGWRGMVGSVLMQRMQEEHDFNFFYSIFFSTSQVGNNAPKISTQQDKLLQNAWNIELLSSLDIIVTCQGSAYTSIVYSRLRDIGWTGYWIDSASYLRMNNDAVIVLDPVNQCVIERGIHDGIKAFVGGNCTVSLMLMALGGLLQQNLVEWISVSTYQAASGYGARAIRELLIQMGQMYTAVSELLIDLKSNILDIENRITELSKTDDFLSECFEIPLAGNVIPWIGDYMRDGQTQEEWKGQSETNKILDSSSSDFIIVDSLCVRISSLRCHSQSIIMRLKKNISLKEVEELIQSHNLWVEVIPNDRNISLNKLNPIMVSGTLNIPIGRIRKMNIGSNYFSAFTVGDQLLWGAAEPLRRILQWLL